MTTAQTRIRSTLWLATTFALLTVACSVEDSLEAPYCGTGGSGLIVAQSVPTAELVPCLDTLPAGWEIDSVKIDQDGTTIRLDSDRAGAGAAILRYRSTCDREEAAAVTSDQDGVDRFQTRDRDRAGYHARRYYVFAGGCVWWDFDLAEDALVTLAIELESILLLYTRDVLNDDIRENFIDKKL